MSANLSEPGYLKIDFVSQGEPIWGPINRHRRRLFRPHRSILLLLPVCSFVALLCICCGRRSWFSSLPSRFTTMRFSQVSPGALTLWLFVTSVLGQESAWQTPDGSKPDYADAFHNADLVTISWDAMTGGLSDLWLNAVESNYAMRLGSNINISTAGTFPWTITVGNEEIDIDSHFQLSFVPSGTSYTKDKVDEYEQSPGFILVKAGEALPTANATSVPSTTSAAAATSAASTSGIATTTSTQSPTSESDDTSGFSTGVKAAMGIGIVAAIAIILGLLFWALRLRRRVKAANNHRSSGIIPSSGLTPDGSAQRTEKRISGLHEASGDRLQPVEMSARPKTVYHELAG